MKLKVSGLAKKMAEFVVSYAVMSVLIVAAIFISLKAPEVHNFWQRSKVGSKVYMIRDHEDGGGGTGFAVRAPSGTSYILTNDHVCGVSKDGLTVLVTNEDGDSIRRRIIAHDQDSDLCLVEGLPGVEGLALASRSPRNGEILTVIGHPHLLPLSLTKGEIVGTEDVSIVMGPISVQDPEDNKWKDIPADKGGIAADKCTGGKYSQQDIDFPLIFFTVKVKMCVVTVKDAYITSDIVYPGNSGSPSVNFFSQVNGVVFSTDSTGWARMVSLSDLKDFIKSY
jgi:S1-C subfamily serine protease